MSGHPDERLLALYAGGELAAEERQEIAAHVAGCSGCQGELRELQSVRELLAAAFTEPGEEDLRAVRQGLAAGLRDKPKSNAGIWLWAGCAAAAAASFLVVLNVKEGAPSPIRIDEPTVQIQSLPPVERPMLPLPLPLRAAAERGRHVRKATRDEGIREVAWIARRDAPPQLRVRTADPNVVILLNLNGEARNP